MSIKNTTLRKSLMLMFADQALRTKKLREDIRRDIRKDTGNEEGGGDFHVPFWADAKAHVNEEKYLDQSVIERVAKNNLRSRLYPRLRTGFLDWYENKRRWSNKSSSSKILKLGGKIEFAELDCSIKVDNLLALSIGESANRVIYPYFSEFPLLNERSARLGLWALKEALPNKFAEELRILDIIRGNSFSLTDVSLLGSEEAEFAKLYGFVLTEWDRLNNEYRAA